MVGIERKRDWEGRKGERGRKRKMAAGLRPVVSSASLHRFSKQLQPLIVAGVH